MFLLFNVLFAEILRFKHFLVSFQLKFKFLTYDIVPLCACASCIQTIWRNSQLQIVKQIELNSVVIPPVFMFAYNFFFLIYTIPSAAGISFSVNLLWIQLWTNSATFVLQNCIIYNIYFEMKRVRVHNSDGAKKIFYPFASLNIPDSIWFCFLFGKHRTTSAIPFLYIQPQSIVLISFVCLFFFFWERKFCSLSRTIANLKYKHTQQAIKEKA